MNKNFVKKVIVGSRALRSTLNLVTGDFPKVLVYHRFAAPGSVVAHRVSGDEFGWQLDQILGAGFRVATLAECLDFFRREGKWPRRSVIVTVDDGYRDFYQWAYPELKKRGLKATFFVTANFLDGKIWLWPDRLEHAVAQTTRSEATVRLDGGERRLALESEAERWRSFRELIDYCVSCPDRERERVLVEVTAALGVPLPELPPSEFGAVSWDELREMLGHGIEVGSHTMNHPILSRVDGERLQEEVFRSKQLLEQKTGVGISSFCYPNSAPKDITDEVVQAVQRAGYTGAVFGVDLKSWQPYRVPRMGVSHDRTDFLWKLHGGESL